MKTTTLEAWRLYAARCKRLDAEEAALARPEPWLIRAGLTAEVWGLLMGAELLALCWLAGLF